MSNRKDRNQTIILVFLIAVTVFSLIPLLYISKYTGPILDDYQFAANVHRTWIETGSFFKALQTGIDTTISYYFTWQGSLVSLFLYILNPGSFSEKYYWINGVFVIVFFVTSQYYLIKTVFYKHLKCSLKTCILLWLLLIFVFLNYIPSTAEGFYFFTDAVTYTSFYSVICFHIALMFDLSETDSKLVLALDIIFALISAGGHLSMAVFSVVLTFIFVLYHFFFKTGKFRKFTVVLIFVTIALLINALAPGYRVRTSYEHGLGFIPSIVFSFVQTFREANAFFRLETIPVVLIMVILFWEIPLNSVRKIKKPILLTGLCIAVYSTQFMADFYGVGQADYLRQQNIAFFSFYWLLAGSLFIWVFYYRQKGVSISFHYQTIPHFSLVFILLVTFSVLATGNLNAVSSISAIRNISSGNIQAYRNERNNWIETIENSNGNIPVISPIKHHVELIDPWDTINVWPEWVLESMSNYYGVDSICLAEE